MESVTLMLLTDSGNEMIRGTPFKQHTFYFLLTNNFLIFGLGGRHQVFSSQNAQVQVKSQVTGV